MYTPDPNEDKCCILASFHHTYMPLSTIRACGREVEVEERGGEKGRKGIGGGGCLDILHSSCFASLAAISGFLVANLGGADAGLTGCFRQRPCQ